MDDIKMVIISNREIAKDTYEMVLGCRDGGHGITRPGQFVDIKIDGFYLRRPISVCDWTEDELTIIYKVVGSGTRIMSRYDSGRELDMLTPLGNGFDIGRIKGDMPVIIGGGAGVPPMYGLYRRLKEKGTDAKIVLGFGSADEVFYEKEFLGAGADAEDIIITTEDGSCGEKGYVTDVLGKTGYTYFCACGPEAMLKAIDDMTDRDIGGQMSFEARMGCGFGACMGCSCMTKKGSVRICREGPVLGREDVIW